MKNDNQISDVDKIPMPPVKNELYFPISFWTEILLHLDKKAQTICQKYGWGKIDMQIIIQNGEINQVVFNDEIRVKGLAQKSRSSSDRVEPTIEAK